MNRGTVVLASAVYAAWLAGGPSSASGDAQGSLPESAPVPPFDAVAAEFRGEIPGAMKAEAIPGLAVALLDREGVEWAEGFGFTDDDRKTAITPDTLFSVQSMSKTVTATATMLAVRDGLVQLETPIKAYLPGFTVKSRFERRPEEKMTLRPVPQRRLRARDPSRLEARHVPAQPRGSRVRIHDLHGVVSGAGARHRRADQPR